MRFSRWYKISYVDASIHMFQYKIKTAGILNIIAGWKVIPGHNKTVDHTEVITGLCSISKTGVFASVGNDSYLRIWNRYNQLIR